MLVDLGDRSSVRLDDPAVIPQTTSMTPTPQLRLERTHVVAPVGSRYLLKDLSTEIFAGERVVVAGASGAGKTLLLQLLNGRVEPSGGKIYLEGKDLQQIAPLKLRRSITLVPQEPKLLGMSVEQTLAYPLKLRDLKPAEIDRRVREWRERLQIPIGWMARTEAQLSLGQRQQVALARALAIQPAILLLDDPLVLLDGNFTDRLLSVLSELCQTQQMTAIVSARQLQPLQNFGTRLLYLHQGQLQQDTAGDRIPWTTLTSAIAQTELQTAREWDE